MLIVNCIPELTKKFHVVLHGIDEEIFYPIKNYEKEIIRNSYIIRKEDFVILTASRLIKRKGQDMLI